MRLYSDMQTILKFIKVRDLHNIIFVQQSVNKVDFFITPSTPLIDIFTQYYSVFFWSPYSKSLYY